MPWPHSLRRAALALALAHMAMGSDAETAERVTPSVSRQQALVHIVRQDCGSCHGMRLTGGLGPPLTATALSERPLLAVVSTILHGRPGTPMPGWHPLLSEEDAQWIARQLQAGFPEESTP
ncbi:c-type cytochrome [Aquabacterium sp.]|uniref:c-type cytochrome n=1 Tax=Aquabacterium sp. TaxID=1872578 RepID=UPI0039C88C9F